MRDERYGQQTTGETNVSTRPKVVGLCGKKGAGKDTAAGKLLDLGWARVSFADTLKQVCNETFQIPIHLFHDPEVKDKRFDEPLRLNEEAALELLQKLPYTVPGQEVVNKVIAKMDGKEIWSFRELLQFIGTDVCRDCIDTNIWFQIGMNKIQDWQNRGENVVVTDVRFDNEAEGIKNLGGDVIHIIRPEVEEGQTELEQHASESITWTVDWTLYNTGTEENLQDQLIKYIE